jgi:hypothetical protein
MRVSWRCEAKVLNIDDDQAAKREIYIQASVCVIVNSLYSQPWCP